MRIERLRGNPIIRPHMDARMGKNINGPSLIRVPNWIDDPLGTYYLYFADHKGHYIRLAYADRLEGPWRMYEPGTLQLEQSHFLTTPPMCRPSCSPAWPKWKSSVPAWSVWKAPWKTPRRYTSPRPTPM